MIKWIASFRIIGENYNFKGGLFIDEKREVLAKEISEDIDNFNQQYPTLKVEYTEIFHDRFLIIDGRYAYHIGASIKDAGKKCFGINKIG